MPKTNRLLSVAQLADLFSQLHRLESAGLPALQAFQILAESGKDLKKPLTILRQQLTAGKPISEAGFRAGVFNDTQKALIHAAEAGGQLAAVYAELANYYTLKNTRLKKIKSRLYLPVLMLILSLFLQPLPGLISGATTAPGYLLLSLGRLFGIAICAVLFIQLPDILAALGLERAWHGLQLRIPPLKNWIVNRRINEFLIMLAFLLEAGMTFSAAFPKAVAGIKNTVLRAEFAQAITANRHAKGDSVTDTLAGIAPINSKILQIVKTSEHSGKLAGGLLRSARLEAETYSLQDDALADWIPRLIYSLIALWMASAILGSQFALPKVDV